MKYPRAQLIRSPQFSDTRSSSFTTLRQITSPRASLVLFFYSQSVGRDLWTTVRWPTGQRAATGGKVMTGPMYGMRMLPVVAYADVQRDHLSNCPK